MYVVTLWDYDELDEVIVFETEQQREAWLVIARQFLPLANLHVGTTSTMSPNSAIEYIKLIGKQRDKRNAEEKLRGEAPQQRDNQTL